MDRHDVCKEAEPVASGGSVPPRCRWAVRRELTDVDACCDVRFNEDRIQGIGHRAQGRRARGRDGQEAGRLRECLLNVVVIFMTLALCISCTGT
jgi:hypothetical protein